MASIAASAEADRNALRLREKELAAVKINAAEVDIIANELELDRKVAERTLGNTRVVMQLLPFAPCFGNKLMTDLSQTRGGFDETLFAQTSCH
ncbi:hypothetical protein MLD38_038802 [Melastoma candidum]|uniref:Uncharacterized protein n=1 Tax=Melastoma candidum TaxID=119954 RepID=A0ACB9L2D5_9MYRT|nr:hypothetical protein MLD38_038802 [Melastoma candidum]